MADFLEFGELLAMDALDRAESCGGHFREEYQTHDGEALRRDDEFCHVSVWEYKGEVSQAVRGRKSRSNFEYAKPSQRSYK